MNCCFALNELGNKSRPEKDEISADTANGNEDNSNEKPERPHEADLRELFRVFDTNNERSIPVEDLSKALLFLGMNPSEQEVADAMEEVAVNESGRIGFQAFYNFLHAEMAKVDDPDQPVSEDMVRSAFRTFDKDGNGFIDETELRQCMMTLGECLIDREMEDMIRQTNVDEDGKVNYEEFIQMWCKIR